MTIFVPGATFPLPTGNRPSCVAKVSFNVFLCKNLMEDTWRYSFSDFSVDYDLCPSLISWFMALPPSMLDDHIRQFEYDASLMAEHSYINATIPPIPTQCPDIILTTEFSTEICYNSCYRLLNEPPYFIVTKNKCGDQCCIRTREGCKSISGTFIILGSPTFSTKGTPCGEYIPECRFNYIPLNSRCGRPCGIPIE